VYTAVCTALTWSCTRPVYGAVYAPYTRPCIRPVHSGIHDGPCTSPVHGSVNVRVHGLVHCPSCTWQVGLPGRVDVPRRHAMAVCGPLYVARSMQCIRPCTTAVTAVRDVHVYTAVKRPCTRHVHVRLHGQYTVVYMAGRPVRQCTRAETARYGRGPCTRP